MNNKNLKYNLSALGNKVIAPNNPNDAILECVPNQYQKENYVVRFTCPEFTSLCPITQQPDFATIVIDYIPNKNLVESKSLKLFFQSFRNHNDFHEACTIYIAKRLEEALKPIWLRVNSYWYPRGGIPIDVFYQTSSPPNGVYIEPIKINTFQGR